jgi:glutaconate CoA-transferase subunit A
VAPALPLDEAIAQLVPAGGTVGIGGMHATAAPMALVRELVRQDVRIGCLVPSPSSSLQVDLPIGAGLVDQVVCSYIGFEDLGLAPCFRRAAEGGTLEVLECDEGALTHALYGGAAGLPFVPLPSAIGQTDIPRSSPQLYQETVDPFTGTAAWAVRSLRPDAALIACSVADEEGNVAFDRMPFTDRLLALAARRLVVQVEQVVSTAEIAAHEPGTTLPAFLVSAVVVAPGGCRPTASPGWYERDEDGLRAYVKAAATDDGLAELLAEIRSRGESTVGAGAG